MPAQSTAVPGFGPAEGFTSCAPNLTAEGTSTPKMRKGGAHLGARRG